MGMGVGVFRGEDEEDEVEAEAYMRSGLMALRMLSTPISREGTPDGKRRKKVAWAGDEEEEEEEKEKEEREKGKREDKEEETKQDTKPKEKVEEKVATQQVIEEQKVEVDDCIDEDGHVWLLQLRERAREAIRSGVRKEDMALFSVHLTYSPTEYDRTPLDPPTAAERSCCLPDRNSRVFADAYDALTRSENVQLESEPVEEESMVWGDSSINESSSWDAGMIMEEDHSQESEVEEERVVEKATAPQAEEDEWEAWLDQRKSAKSAIGAGCSLAAAAVLVDTMPLVPAPRRTNQLLSIGTIVDEDLTSDTPSLASTASSGSSSDHSHCLQQAAHELTTGISMGSSPSGDAFLESWLPYSSSYCRREDEGAETPGTDSDATLKPSKSGKKFRRGLRSTTFKGSGFGGGFGSSEFGSSVDGEGCLGGF